MMFRRNVSIGLCFCTGGGLLAARQSDALKLNLGEGYLDLEAESKRWEAGRLPALTQEIILPAEGEIVMNLTRGVKNLPKY